MSLNLRSFAQRGADYLLANAPAGDDGNAVRVELRDESDPDSDNHATYTFPALVTSAEESRDLAPGGFSEPLRRVIRWKKNETGAARPQEGFLIRVLSGDSDEPWHRIDTVHRHPLDPFHKVTTAPVG